MFHRVEWASPGSLLEILNNLSLHPRSFGRNQHVSCVYRMQLKVWKPVTWSRSSTTKASSNQSWERFSRLFLNTFSNSNVTFARLLGQLTLPSQNFHTYFFFFRANRICLKWLFWYLKVANIFPILSHPFLSPSLSLSFSLLFSPSYVLPLFLSLISVHAR